MDNTFIKNFVFQNQCFDEGLHFDATESLLKSNGLHLMDIVRPNKECDYVGIDAVIVFSNPTTKSVYTRKVDYKFRTGDYGKSDILLNMEKKGRPGWAHKNCKKQNDLIINVNRKNRVACSIKSEEIWSVFDHLNKMPNLEANGGLQKNVAVKWKLCRQLFVSFTLVEGF